MVDFCRDMLTGNFQISQEMITIVRIYRKYFPENQHLLINIFARLAAINSVAWYCRMKYCNTKDQKVPYMRMNVWIGVINHVFAFQLHISVISQIE